MSSVESRSQNKTYTKSLSFSALDAFKRLPRRSRAQSYRTLDEIAAGRDAVAWYWRLVGVGASFMIIGGFLMLPPTYEKEHELRVRTSVVEISAIALLAAGFSFTALLSFAVRNPLFRIDCIYLPALTSCALGLLTVLYNFLVFTRYRWNTAALLVTLATLVGSIIYAGLLIWMQRRLNAIKAKAQDTQQVSVPLTHLQPQMQNRESESTLYQENTYYENYNRNMFQSAYPSPLHLRPNSYDPISVTEQEMQRQQMLMLLLNKDQPSRPDPSQSTFRIDWQNRDEDESPSSCRYEPQSGLTSAYLSSSLPPSSYPSSGISSSGTNEMRPWDGVWREVRQPTSQELREARRRDIEQSTRRA